MSSKIHPTAIIEKGAQLGADVEIGAYAYVGSQVVMGDGNILHHHASVEGNTVLGKGNELYPYCVVGGKTQDLKFKGGNPGLRIGDRNAFREFVTIHGATNDGDFTIVGSENNLLAYTHIAHDCIIGNGIIMSNYAGLAGHVVIEDGVVVGGYGGVHQFCRVGQHAMIGGCAKVVQDVPPFMIADGAPATARAINKVGLERAGYSSVQIDRVKSVHRVLYREGLNRSQALEKLGGLPDSQSAEYQCILRFAHLSQRGLIAGS
jgi:UDP-N-acetylglucosamine acyltransferase